MCANPAAGWPSTPTSKLSRWCGWSSTNSIAKAACTDCYATWSITLSACRFGLTTGLIGESWSGVVPIGRHSKICYIIRSMPATTVTATAPSTPVGRCLAGPGRTINRPEDCLVLLENRCPAYITPQRFWANQERLAANRARTEAAGAVRQGPSLLGGILRCGRCGQRMMVAYSGRASRLRYSCGRAMVEYAEPLCQGLAGRVLDDLVAAQVLAVLEPAALELSLAAADYIEQERARLHRNWQQQLERAHYQAERAKRQYDAVEPENRLVVRELERGWEEALKEQRRLEEEYARFRRNQPEGLSACERERIRSLVRDIPALWQAPATTAADRQRIVRLLVKEVVVAVRGESKWVDVTIP